MYYSSVCKKETFTYTIFLEDTMQILQTTDLKKYYGEYAGITKLDKISSLKLKIEIENMIEDGYYDQWYENALVNLIFKTEFKLFYIDIKNYDWTEVDSVNDLLNAKKIHLNEKLKNT